METIKNYFTKRLNLFIFIFSLIFSTISWAKSSYSVCDKNCDFNNIYTALKKVKDGDTIIVSSSQILTSAVVINKSIHLIGKNFPVFDGLYKSKMLFILANDVEVSGFIFKNSLVSFLEDISAIKIEAVSNVYIHHNKLINNAYGIYLAKAKNCRIENNQIEGVDRGDTESGSGIHIWSGKGHQIVNNVITKNRDGIYFEFVSDSKIIANTSFKNSRYGLHFMFSHHNEYLRNHFTFNSSGVAVMYSKNIKMEDNEFSESVGGGAYGLLLKDISMSKITHNKFVNNSIGIYVEGTNKSHFNNNLFLNNVRALRVFGNCEGNYFTSNVFLKNIFEVSSNSSVSLNIFEKNYWSHYSGYDLNNDGIGDVPHRPVGLSSILTENINSSFIFVHSPFFYLLDSVEKALPTFGPANLFDQTPKMSIPKEYL